MKSSHPARCLYGGILERLPAPVGDPVRLRCWDGKVWEAREGDVMVLYRTAAWVTLVEVEAGSEVHAGGAR